MHRQLALASTRAPVPADAPITWIGSPPADEDARVVWDTLVHEGVTRHAALVDRVGERLFRRELRSLGAAADIGFFRPFYVAHARALVAALDGTALRIGRPVAP
jgi:hypothetical protein